MRRAVLLFVVVFLFMTLITMSAILISTIYTPKTQLNPTAKKAFEQLETLKKPPFAPDSTEWETIVTSDPQAINGLPLNVFLSTKSAEIANLKLIGGEWVNKRYYETSEEFSKTWDITSYYTNTLEKEGWKPVIEVDGKKIIGIAASSPLGNVVSLLKLEDKSIQIFVLSTQISSTKCPCTTATQVFVGRPIPLSLLFN